MEQLNVITGTNVITPVSVDTFVSTHVYGIELKENDPQYSQPTKIKIPLKPHQKTALCKAVQMETVGKINYNIESPDRHVRVRWSANPYPISLRGDTTVETNIGIMGDIVGYGKTLTALSLIAQVNVRDIYVNNVNVQSSFGKQNSGMFKATCERVMHNPDRYINTTLVIVPRGPVYVQWENSIDRHTTLKKLSIDSLSTIRKNLPGAGTTFADLKAYFEKFDIVLIKNTTLKTLMDFYYVPLRTDEEHPLAKWSRIMVDEAHDIISKIPLFSFKFLWLISATYQYIMDHVYGTRNQLSYVVRDIFNEERVNLCLLKGESNFVKQSFSIPEPVEYWYVCEMPLALTAIQPFLNANIQKRLNANDIIGAIRELGGKDETEDNIVSLFTRELDKEIDNKGKEIEYLQSIDIPQDQREHRINNVEQDLSKLKERKVLLIERITELSEKTCSICYDNFSGPIVLPCTHIFCGKCLINWMRSGKVCPECRAPIKSKELIAVVDEKNSENSAESSVKTPIKNKEDTLIDIIRSKESGKFLVFTTIDAGFWSLMKKLEMNNISYTEMKGSTSHMMNVLEKFKSGEIKVILLNTYYAGSGIDMSFATDVVIYHAMGIERVQAIGRAQRQGRTEQLSIHNLCYPNELEISN